MGFTISIIRIFYFLAPAIIITMIAQIGVKQHLISILKC